MGTLGVRSLITIAVANDSVVLRDEVELARRLDGALANAGFLVVNSSSHLFCSPVAITAVRILSESHVVVHTWPEYELVTVDLFSCLGSGRVDDFVNEIVPAVGGVVVGRSDDAVHFERSPTYSPE